METKIASQIMWIMMRRSAFYGIAGALIGTIAGAIFIGLAGASLGLSEHEYGHIGLTQAILEKIDAGIQVIDTTMQLDTLPYLVKSLLTGWIIGAQFGAIIGGIVGLIGFVILGVIDSPARTFWPAKNTVTFMLKAMSFFTTLATAFYMIWLLILAPHQSNFSEQFREGISYAALGIPLVMGIGQIVGICHATSRLRTS